MWFRVAVEWKYALFSGLGSCRLIDTDYDAYLSNLSGSGVRSSGWKLDREIRDGSAGVEGCVTHSHYHPCDCRVN